MIYLWALNFHCRLIQKLFCCKNLSLSQNLRNLWQGILVKLYLLWFEACYGSLSWNYAYRIKFISKLKVCNANIPWQCQIWSKSFGYWWARLPTLYKLSILHWIFSLLYAKGSFKANLHIKLISSKRSWSRLLLSNVWYFRFAITVVIGKIASLDCTSFRLSTGSSCYQMIKLVEASQSERSCVQS